MDLHELNQSELLELVFIHRGYRLRRDTLIDRLIQLLEDDTAHPTAAEIPATQQTRAELEQWILKNWGMIQSQLPCKLANRGRCTIYPCTEVRHISCWTFSKSAMRMGL
jgi:hypothetical protein